MVPKGYSEAEIEGQIIKWPKKKAKHCQRLERAYVVSFDNSK